MLNLKQKLQATKVTYANYSQPLWDFAELELSIQNAVESMCASFSISEKKKKIGKLHDAILDIEGDLHIALAKVSPKESIHRFFNMKMFGTFE